MIHHSLNPWPYIHHLWITIVIVHHCSFLWWFSLPFRPLQTFSHPSASFHSSPPASSGCLFLDSTSATSETRIQEINGNWQYDFEVRDYKGYFLIIIDYRNIIEIILKQMCLNFFIFQFALRQLECWGRTSLAGRAKPWVQRQQAIPSIACRSSKRPGGSHRSLRTQDRYGQE